MTYHIFIILCTKGIYVDDFNLNDMEFRVEYYHRLKENADAVWLCIRDQNKYILE